MLRETGEGPRAEPDGGTQAKQVFESEAFPYHRMHRNSSHATNPIRNTTTAIANGTNR